MLLIFERICKIVNTDIQKTNKYLVVCRVGENSLHKEWLYPASYKNFDLFIDYYGSQPGKYSNDGDFYIESKGLKWPGIYSLIDKFQEKIFEYDAVWFPDDDISADALTINVMFRLFSEYNLKIAQPALTYDSYFTHGITIENNNFILRYTDFVEVMVPIFSRSTLMKVWKTFDKSKSGWGLDNIWPKLIISSKKDMAILDKTPVKHTRPVGGGELYSKLNISPHLEVRKLLREYKVLLKKHNVFSGILSSNEPMISKEIELNLAYHLLNGTPSEIRSNNKFVSEYLYPNMSRLMLETSKRAETEVNEIINKVNNTNISQYILELSKYHDSFIFHAIETHTEKLISLLNIVGRGFIGINQPERGLEYLNNAYLQDEESSETLYNLARTFHELKMNDKAIKFLSLIKDKEPKVIDLLIQIKNTSY